MQKEILRYCDALTNANPEVFRFNKTDLRPAIEKKLYFSHVDDNETLTRYIKTTKIDLNKKSTLFSTYLRHLVRKVRLTFSSLDQPEVYGKTSAPLAITFSRKHVQFLEGLKYDVEFLPDGLITKQMKVSIPELKNTSRFLITFHYDLLVFFEAMSALLKKKSPSFILLVEGNSHFDCIATLCSKSIGLKSLCIQYGWAFTVHLGFQRMMHDYFLGWGTPFNRVLSPYNECTKFINFGHAYSDTYKGNPIDRDPLCISVLLQAPARWIGEDTFDQFIDTCVSLAQKGFKLLVREHPSWKVSEKHSALLIKEPNVNLINPTQVSLEYQMHKSTFSITIMSSVGFESMLFGVIPIFYQPYMKIDMEPKLENEDFCFVFKEEMELSTHIERLISDDNALETLRLKLKLASQVYFEYGAQNQLLKFTEIVLSPSK
ncbi:MAG: hypothetical protein WEC59_08945 [Salibacteraceae bacterium]